ncbi:MAG: hypothetical protein WEA76_04350 [Acidimicrobiia bacterium]
MDQPHPSFADLIAVLRRELAILERLRYSHRQLRVLLETGDSRFLGVALDELSEVVVDLDLAETLRVDATAKFGSALHLRPTPTLNDLIVRLPPEFGQLLRSLQQELDGLLDDVDIERRRVRTLSHARVTPGPGTGSQG